MPALIAKQRYKYFRRTIDHSRAMGKSWQAIHETTKPQHNIDAVKIAVTGFAQAVDKVQRTDQ